MLRRCVLTVFSETDSSPAISGRDRLVGRYRSTLSSPGLSSSVGGDEDGSWAAGDELCTGSHGKYARKTAWCVRGRCAVVGLGAGVVPALVSQVVMTCRLAESARTDCRGEGGSVLMLLHRPGLRCRGLRCRGLRCCALRC